MSEKYFEILVYGIIAAFFLRVVVYNLFREILSYIQLRRRGKIVYGKVVGIKTIEDVDRLVSYYPIIEYFVDNKPYCLSPKEERSMSKPEIGSLVSLLHDKLHPEKAVLNTSGAISHLFLKTFFILVVLVILWVALFNIF